MELRRKWDEESQNYHSPQNYFFRFDHSPQKSMYLFITMDFLPPRGNEDICEGGCGWRRLLFVRWG